jgi:N-acetyl sugar amidotransferase
MKRCTSCLSPDTRPGVVFEGGVCPACRRLVSRSEIDYGARQQVLSDTLKMHRECTDGYDCLIPVSGGKDSHYQVYMMKVVHGMNPLLCTVTDDFEHTRAGEHNAKNIASAFGCDIITLRVNPVLNKKLTIEGFKQLGSTNWGIDKAIYSWPIRVAEMYKIGLVLYGENVAWEYGGVNAVDTWDASAQISNDIVKPDGEKILEQLCANSKERISLTYPAVDVQSMYLSYFYRWDDLNNLYTAKRYGFKTLAGEWDRQGYIDDYAQIDSVGYLMNYHLKYLKYGIGRVTDIGSRLVRRGLMDINDLRNKIKESDMLLDERIKDDFLRYTGLSSIEFHSILDGHTKVAR